MNKTGIVRDEKFMDHRPGPYHPESHKRLEALYDMLEENEMSEKFIEIPRTLAEKNDLELIHSPEYVRLIEDTAGREGTFLDADTSTSSGSYDAACLAAGGLCKAISMVMEGDLDNAFALVRPPGHHAERNRAMGFCLFNNVAIGAGYAKKKYGVERILIVDWDLHHGNGTQHSFEDDPSVLYFSTHQYPYYPGSGSFGETGSGNGRGYTLNVPLSTGHGDGEFAALFEQILVPVAGEYKPELILVSAGFDIYQFDPLGGMMVTPDGFAALTRALMNTAVTCCDGKLVMTLEGGYHIKGLRDSVRAVLREMLGSTHTDVEDMARKADKTKMSYLLSNVEKTHGRTWKSLF
ncbi:histone deacetylase [Thermodesulfobacteriota bacterium]